MPVRRWSIRARLVALIIGVSLPLLVVLTWLFIQQVQREALDARDLARRIADSIASDLSDQTQRSRELLAGIAARPAVRSAATLGCDPLFSATDFFPQHLALQLYDGAGKVVCSASTSLSRPPVIRPAESWAASYLASTQQLPRDPVLLPVEGEWVSVIFKAVNDGTRRTGTLAMFQRVDFNLDAAPAGTVVTILDRNTRVIARSKDPQKWINRQVNAQIVRIAVDRGQGTIEAEGLDGQRRQYGFTTVNGTEWYLYAGISSRLAMAGVWSLVLRGAMVGLVLIAGIVFLALLLSRSIERPLEQLVESVQRVGDEGYGGQVAVSGPTEITKLAESFNRMVIRRGEAQAQLEISRFQLEALSKRLLQTQEEERSRIAREIHDELGQLLTALNMDVRGLISSAGPLTEVQLTMVDRIILALEETLSSVQRISSELRPAILDDFGLLAAVESYVRTFEERTGIECELSLPQSLPAIGAEAETAIYRIVQESMTNIARHSDATRAEVRVRERGDALYVNVRDDGRGASPEDIRSSASIGLVGMRERAHRVGATIEVEGIAGQGTIVSLRLPLAQNGVLTT